MTPILVGGAEWMHSLGAGDLDTCPPHHIRLESPGHAPTVMGVCRKCGYQRMYSAYGEDDVRRWGGDRSCDECGTRLFPQSRTCPKCSGKAGARARNAPVASPAARSATKQGKVVSDITGRRNRRENRD